jgi:hypothetical protein
MSTEDLYDFSPELEQVFEKAEVKLPDGNKFEDIPDGEYVVQLVKAELKKFEKTGDKQVSYQLKVMQGDHKGRVVFKNSFLNAKGMPFFKSEMAFMGLKMTKLADLKDIMETLNPVDPADRILLRIGKAVNKTNPKYSNIYFNEVLSAEDLEEQAPLAAGEDPGF